MSFRSVINNSNNKNKGTNTYAWNGIKFLHAPSHSTPKTKKGKKNKNNSILLLPLVYWGGQRDLESVPNVPQAIQLSK